MIQFGTPEAIATKICEDIRPFGSYAFNKSHSASYAFVALQTAYFKTYYPIEFFSGLLTVFGDKEERLSAYIREAKRMGISIVPPHINNSGSGFEIIKDENGQDVLSFGLSSIDGLGPAAIDYILENRPYESIEHMIEVSQKKYLNKSAVRSLSLSGALDAIAPDVKNRMHLLQLVFLLRKDKDNLQEEIDSFNDFKKLLLEKQYLKTYVSGHPLEGISRRINWDNVHDNEPIEFSCMIESVKEIRTKKGDPMAFVSVDTLEGVKELVLFPNIYEEVHHQLIEGVVLKIQAYFKYSPQYDTRSLIVKKINIPKRINKDLLS